MLYRVYNPETGLYLKAGCQGWSKTGKTWTGLGAFKNAAHGWWHNYMWRDFTGKKWQDYLTIPDNIPVEKLELHVMDTMTEVNDRCSFKIWFLTHIIDYCSRHSNTYSGHKYTRCANFMTEELLRMALHENHTEMRAVDTGNKTTLDYVIRGKRSEDFEAMLWDKDNLEQISAWIKGHGWEIQFRSKLANSEYSYTLVHPKCMAYHILSVTPKTTYLIYYPLDKRFELVQKGSLPDGRFHLSERECLK